MKTKSITKLLELLDEKQGGPYCIRIFNDGSGDISNEDDYVVTFDNEQGMNTKLTQLYNSLTDNIIS